MSSGRNPTPSSSISPQPVSTTTEICRNSTAGSSIQSAKSHGDDDVGEIIISLIIIINHTSRLASSSQYRIGADVEKVLQHLRQMKVCAYFAARLSVCRFEWWSMVGFVIVVGRYRALFGSALLEVGGRREILLFSLIRNNSFSHFRCAPSEHTNQFLSFTHHVSLFICVSYSSNSNSYNNNNFATNVVSDRV